MRKPTRRTSAKHSTTRLLREDYREVSRLCDDFKKGEGTVIRELVHEALKVRRLRKTGRDETTAPVRDAQREIVRSEIAEMKAQVKEILDLEDRMFGMLEDLQSSLGPLIFEVLFDTWTDARATREIAFETLLLPNTPEAKLAGKTPNEYAAHLYNKALKISRAWVAKHRTALDENPLASRRYTPS